MATVIRALPFEFTHAGISGTPHELDLAYAESRRSTALAWPTVPAQHAHDLWLWLERCAVTRELEFDHQRCRQTATSMMDAVWYFVCDTFSDRHQIRRPILTYTRVRDHLAFDCGARYQTACEVAFSVAARHERAGIYGEWGWL